MALLSDAARSFAPDNAPPLIQAIQATEHSMPRTSSTRALLCASRLAIVLALICTAMPAFAGKRRDCGCANLPQIEQEITEQEFLHQLFSQWADYMPGSILTTEGMRDRAETIFNLAFYGAAHQAPQAAGSGAGAAFGTLYKDANCPLVEYIYDKNGNPVYRETRDSRTQHLSPPVFERATRNVTESQYKSNQCAALVHYSFVHEQHHQDKCEVTTKAGNASMWDNLHLFAVEDKEAYAAGLEVLYAERAKLQRQCKRKTPRDGRWRGTLQYAYTYNDYGSEEIAKGKDPVHPNGTGTKEWGQRKSVRAKASINAPAEGGNIQVAYTGSRQESWFNKGTFVMQSECGWTRHPVWKLNNGTETRNDGRISGMLDALLQTDGHTLYVSFRVPDMLDGTFTRHEWDKPEGYCQEENNRQIDNTDGRVETVQGFTVSMKVDIDPDHMDDIDVIRIEPDSGGKGQFYYSLKLHRDAVE
jgi:hypothetical protein